MAVRNKRKRRSHRDYVMEDPGDGLEVNRLIAGVGRIGRKHGSISIFDADNIVIELSGRNEESGSCFHKVSILGEVRRINRSKSRRINGYKDKIGR